MKYLFINSLAGLGSTGRICADKCRELMAQGHECRIAYGREKGNCDDIPTVQIGSKLDYNIHAALNRVTDAHGAYSYAATRRFLEQVREYDPDVIWLHNVHGYYLNLELLFTYLRTCGKKILWTLHDCWTFTGHCAYFDFAQCEKWKTGCHHCPQKHTYPASKVIDNSRGNYEKKKRLFAGIPDVTLITPSQWLADIVKESFLGDYPVEVVHNTINTDIFKPTPSDFREKNGLEGKTILLGVASVWDARKGMRDLLKLAGMLDDGYKLVLVGLTQEQVEQLPPEIMGIRRTNSAVELAGLYTAANLFVNTTYEDNFPTVNLEARACGTRVVSYDTGGCPETLGPGDILVPKGDVDALYRAITRK